MLAEWLTEEPQTEYAWRVTSNWTADEGLPSARMRAALRKLPDKNIFKLAKSEIDQLAQVDFNDVYLLLIDSYGYDAVNIQHWIVLLALFDSNERGTKHPNPPQRLALYADPLEDGLVVWSWEALLASSVREAFKITKVSRIVAAR